MRIEGRGLARGLRFWRCAGNGGRIPRDVVSGCGNGGRHAERGQGTGCGQAQLAAAGAVSRGSGVELVCGRDRRLGFAGSAWLRSKLPGRLACVGNGGACRRWVMRNGLTGDWAFASHGRIWVGRLSVVVPAEAVPGCACGSGSGSSWANRCRDQGKDGVNGWGRRVRDGAILGRAIGGDWFSRFRSLHRAGFSRWFAGGSREVSGSGGTDNPGVGSGREGFAGWMVTRAHLNGARRRFRPTADGRRD